MNIEEFKKDRDTLLSHLENPDYQEVERYCKKYKVPMPENSITILAGLHKARLGVVSELITDEMKEYSRNWLKKNGFRNDFE